MADLLDRAHIDAGILLLRADTGLVVYPTAAGLTPVSPATPYVRVYGTIERPADASGNALTGTSQQWVTRWYCHCVGVNEYAAIAVAMRVRVALLDVRPVIAGRNCSLIREEQYLPPGRDDATGSTVFDVTTVYSLTTT